MAMAQGELSQKWLICYPSLKIGFCEVLMMTTSFRYSLFDVTYPDSDGWPMAESDATRDYLIY